MAVQCVLSNESHFLTALMIFHDTFLLPFIDRRVPGNPRLWAGSLTFWDLVGLKPERKAGKNRVRSFRRPLFPVHRNFLKIKSNYLSRRAICGQIRTTLGTRTVNFLFIRISYFHGTTFKIILLEEFLLLAQQLLINFRSPSWKGILP